MLDRRLSNWDLLNNFLCDVHFEEEGSNQKSQLTKQKQEKQPTEKTQAKNHLQNV